MVQNTELSWTLIPELIDARFLNGWNRSINTMPMLKICTPPPDMYNIKACIGRDFAGETARSHARFSFSAAYELVVVDGDRGFVLAYVDV